MNRPQTHTVVSGYTDRDGNFRVMVKGHPLPLLSDEPLPEGAAVRIEGGKAVKA